MNGVDGAAVFRVADTCHEVNGQQGWAPDMDAEGIISPLSRYMAQRQQGMTKEPSLPPTSTYATERTMAPTQYTAAPTVGQRPPTAARQAPPQFPPSAYGHNSPVLGPRKPNRHDRQAAMQRVRASVVRLVQSSDSEGSDDEAHQLQQLLQSQQQAQGVPMNGWDNQTLWSQTATGTTESMSAVGTTITRSPVQTSPVVVNEQVGESEVALTSALDSMSLESKAAEKEAATAVKMTAAAQDMKSPASVTELRLPPGLFETSMINAAQPPEDSQATAIATTNGSQAYPPSSSPSSSLFSTPSFSPTLPLPPPPGFEGHAMDGAGTGKTEDEEGLKVVMTDVVTTQTNDAEVTMALWESEPQNKANGPPAVSHAITNTAVAVTAAATASMVDNGAKETVFEEASVRMQRVAVSQANVNPDVLNAANLGMMNGHMSMAPPMPPQTEIPAEHMMRPQVVPAMPPTGLKRVVFDQFSLARTPVWWAKWWDERASEGTLYTTFWEEAGDALRQTMKDELESIGEFRFDPRPDLEMVAVQFLEQGNKESPEQAVSLYRTALAVTVSKQLATTVLAARAKALVYSTRSSNHKAACLKLAEADATLCLCLAPRNCGVMKLRGYIRQLLNDLPGALKDLKRALTKVDSYDERGHIMESIARMEIQLATAPIHSPQVRPMSAKTPPLGPANAPQLSMTASSRTSSSNSLMDIVPGHLMHSTSMDGSVHGVLDADTNDGQHEIVFVDLDRRQPMLGYDDTSKTAMAASIGCAPGQQLTERDVDVLPEELFNFDDASLCNTPGWWRTWWERQVEEGTLATTCWEDSGARLRQIMKLELDRIGCLVPPPRTDLDRLSFLFLEQGKTAYPENGNRAQANRDMAVTSYRKALACAPSQPLAAAILARLTKALITCKEGVEPNSALRRVAHSYVTIMLCLEPESHVGLQLRGRIWELDGDRPRALEDMRRALDLAGHDDQARHVITEAISRIHHWFTWKATKNMEKEAKVLEARETRFRVDDPYAPAPRAPSVSMHGGGGQYQSTYVPAPQVSHAHNQIFDEVLNPTHVSTPPRTSGRRWSGHERGFGPSSGAGGFHGAPPPRHSTRDSTRDRGVHGFVDHQTGMFVPGERAAGGFPPHMMRRPSARPAPGRTGYSRGITSGSRMPSSSFHHSSHHAHHNPDVFVRSSAAQRIESNDGWGLDTNTVAVGMERAGRANASHAFATRPHTNHFTMEEEAIQGMPPGMASYGRQQQQQQPPDGVGPLGRYIQQTWGADQRPVPPQPQPAMHAAHAMAGVGAPGMRGGEFVRVQHRRKPMSFAPHDALGLLPREDLGQDDGAYWL